MIGIISDHLTKFDWWINGWPRVQLIGIVAHDMIILMELLHTAVVGSEQ